MLLTDLRRKLKDYWKDKTDLRTGDGVTTVWKLSKAPLTSQTVILYSGSASTVCTEGNQYKIDKDTGILTWLSGAPAANSPFQVDYKYAVFSDAQLYTFLNNGIKAIRNDLFIDTYTNIEGAKNLEHIDSCESTALWVSTDKATTLDTTTAHCKYGSKALAMGMQASTPVAEYDSIYRSMLADPGFEARTSWTTSSCVFYNTASAHAGTYCVQIYGQGTGAVYRGPVSEEIAVEPNTEYLFNMWMAVGDNPAGVPHVKALYYQSPSGSYSSVTSQVILLATSGSSYAYTNFATSFTTPPDTYALRIVIYGAQNAGSAANSAFTYVDDVTLRQSPTWAMYYKKLPFARNIDNYDYFNMWVRIANLSALDDRTAIEVRCGNDSANYLQYCWGWDKLRENDWSHLSFHFSDASTIGTVSLSSVQYLEIRLNENKYSSQALSVGDVVVDDIRISTFPIESTNQLEYRLPKRWFQVHRAEVWDEEGYVGKMIQFETFGNYIRFDETAGDGKFYKLFGYKEFDTLYASGSYMTDLPREYEELVVNHAAAEALESLLVDRSYYQAYSTYVAAQGASVGALQNAAMYYRKLFIDGLRRVRNAKHATEIAPSIKE